MKFQAYFLGNGDRANAERRVGGNIEAKYRSQSFPFRFSNLQLANYVRPGSALGCSPLSLIITRHEVCRYAPGI